MNKIETIEIISYKEDNILAKSSAGNIFNLEYEYNCGDNEGRLYIKGGPRKACLRVKDPLFWLHFCLESDAPLAIEVEREMRQGQVN